MKKAVHQSSSGKRIWFLLAVLLLLFILLSYIIASSQPEEYPDYVSYSPSPTGVKAIYTYLEEETASVGRWSSSPRLLPEQGAGELLLMTEPMFLSGKEMEGYLNFIEAGNTIVLLKSNPQGMFGLKTIQAQTYSEELSNIMIAGETVQAEVASPVRIEEESGDEILLEDEAGIIALQRNVGEGKLITAVTPGWLTNGKVLDHDHLELVLALINQGIPADSILFDEYSHAGENAPTIKTLYPEWLLVFALQALIFTVIWLWYKGKRFGPVLVPREETVRFSDERIKALAAWYQRGQRYQESLAAQADYLKFQLQERFGIPYSKGWKDIGHQLGRIEKTIPKEELSSFLHDLPDVLTKEKISKQEYLLWSGKIDRLREEVENH